MRDFLTYAEFEGFWARFQPETPCGRDVKERLEVFTDQQALEASNFRASTPPPLPSQH